MNKLVSVIFVYQYSKVSNNNSETSEHVKKNYDVKRNVIHFGEPQNWRQIKKNKTSKNYVERNYFITRAGYILQWKKGERKK